MMKLVLALAVAGTLLVSYATGPSLSDVIKSINEANQHTSVAEVKVEPIVIAQTPDPLFKALPVSFPVVQKTVTLEAKNTVVFRGPVMGSTVDKAIRQLIEMSRELAKTDTIYLVLDTPGGSVTDGAEFIDFLEGLPQEVKTITMFAASMGFQIAENNKGERMITRNGTLMSHRAYLGGMEGQLNGEFESRYRMIKRQIDYLETVDIKRIGITMEEYQEKINKEWWVHGYDAAEQKVADTMIILQCGKSMTGEEELVVQTMFGNVSVMFDKCPLFRNPIKVELKGIMESDRVKVRDLMNDLFYDKVKFVRENIVTNKFYQIFQ